MENWIKEVYENGQHHHMKEELISCQIWRVNAILSKLFQNVRKSLLSYLRSFVNIKLFFRISNIHTLCDKNKRMLTHFIQIIIKFKSNVKIWWSFYRSFWNLALTFAKVSCVMMFFLWHCSFPLQYISGMASHGFTVIHIRSQNSILGLGGVCFAVILFLERNIFYLYYWGKSSKFVVFSSVDEELFPKFIFIYGIFT